MEREGPGRLPSLTGLRAAAAGVVLLSHLRYLVPDDVLFTVGPAHVDAWGVMRQGNAGVSLFFLLSGFVLTWSMRSDDRPSRFWGRRGARILPLHVTVWVVWIVLAALGALAAVRWGPALATLVLVQAWIPDPAYHFGAVNPPTWSLSVEVFFYALFPAIALVLPRLGRAALLRLAAACTVVALAIPVACWRLLTTSAEYWSYVFPISRLPEFVLGSALAAWLGRAVEDPGGAEPWLRRLGVRWTAAFAALAYLVAGRLPRVLANTTATLVPFLLVLLAAAVADLEPRRSFWRHPVVLHLGRVSYAVFLVQYLVLDVLLRTVGEATTVPGGVALVGLGIALTLAVAEVAHALVERPAERRLRSGRARSRGDRGPADRDRARARGTP